MSQNSAARARFALLATTLALPLTGAPAASAALPLPSIPPILCVATAEGAAYTAPGSGVVVQGLGDSAPAFHEVGEPTSGEAVKGVMLTIHGGGWSTVGREAVAAHRPTADRWRARGWRTINLTYTACGGSLTDVVSFFDLVREWWPDLPVCATGFSAGGHLALMLAVKRRELACVVAEAAPADLPGLATQRTATGLATYAYAKALGAFGLNALADLSPLNSASTIEARVLMTRAITDPKIPMQQSQDLDAALGGYSDLVTLDAGTATYTHTTVSQISKDWQHRRELNLVAPITGEAPSECEMCGAGAGWERAAAIPGAGFESAIVMTNQVVRGTKPVGTLRTVVNLAATSGTMLIEPTAIALPAGTHRLQTCFGAFGSPVTTFSKCVERTVTLSAPGSATTLAKLIGFGLFSEEYSWAASNAVLTKQADATWTATAGTWRGNHASTVTVPAVTGSG